MHEGDQDQAFEWLSAMQVAAEAAIAGLVETEGRELTEAEIEAFIPAVAGALIDSVAADLRARVPQMIGDHEADTRKLERGNLKRWREAFTAFEVVWKLASEIGAAHNSRYRPEAAARNDYQFEALAQLNAKALLIARECMALMRAGFAEGALARWRALHEVATVAVFLSESDQETALKYLVSFKFHAYQAAMQIDAVIGKGTRDSFTDEELDAMRSELDRLRSDRGFDLRQEYEWTRTGFKRTVISAKKRITFADIEAEAGLQNFRPYYRWASQHNHAGYRPADKGLGLTESAEPMLLVGPSTSGMVDPLQLAAMSLVKCSAAFLPLNTSLDTLVHLRLLDVFEREVGPTAARVEARTRATATRRKYPAQ